MNSHISVVMGRERRCDLEEDAARGRVPHEARTTIRRNFLHLLKRRPAPQR